MPVLSFLQDIFAGRTREDRDDFPQEKYTPAAGKNKGGNKQGFFVLKTGIFKV